MTRLPSVMQGMRVILFLSALILLILDSAQAAGLDLVTSMPLYRVRQVAVDGDLAWAAQNFEGGALLDVSDPARPRVRQRFSPAEMQPMFFKPLPDDKLLLCADRFQGLVIYDVRNPENPTTVSQVALPGMTIQMDVTQTTDGRRLALLARTGRGVDAIDITKPEAPFIADSFTSGVLFTQTVAMADGVVYLADSDDGGLKALRLVSPGRFEPLYQANFSGKCETLLVAGNRLFVGYGTRGVRLFDLPAPTTDGSTPTLRLRSTVLKNRLKASGMALMGDRLIVAGGGSGVAVYNVANSDSPFLETEFPFQSELFGPADAKHVVPHRGLLYVPAWESGLLVLKLDGME